MQPRSALLALAILLAAAPAEAETISGDRIHVIDGDTVVLPPIGGARGEHVRLVGIDAPELSHPRCATETIAAREATAKLRQLLAGQPVTVERHGLDRYGRTLARLTTPAGDVEDAMLAAGLALPYEPGREAWARRADYWCKETMP
jgi:endonuclease YncB( thermonuclease family)